MVDSVRENDTVARLGSDEFAIVQTGINGASGAAVLAGKILRVIKPAFFDLGPPVRVGVSIGMAFALLDGVDTDEVLSKADAALYRSRVSGRGCYKMFSANI